MFISSLQHHQNNNIFELKYKYTKGKSETILKSLTLVSSQFLQRPQPVRAHLLVIYIVNVI